MKKLISSKILIVIGITSFLTILSCEGPEGPAGQMGQAGPQGDAGAPCTVEDNGDGTYTMIWATSAKRSSTRPSALSGWSEGASTKRAPESKRPRRNGVAFNCPG